MMKRSNLSIQSFLLTILFNKHKSFVKGANKRGSNRLHQSQYQKQAKHGVSLDMQRSKITAYADLEDMDLVDIIADEGISGCNIKGRPGIQRALAMVKSREIKAVIVYKLDRLRNTIEALQVAKLMDRNGVALHSITEKLDTKSAMGRFFFTLMASIAEMERGIISERIQAAMDRKREKNEPCSDNPPFGYRIVEKPAGSSHPRKESLQQNQTTPQGRSHRLGDS